MSPKTKKILYNNKAKAKVTTIVLLMLLVSISSFFVVNNNTTSAAGENWWNADWDYRKLFTIDHNYVAGDLTNYPAYLLIDDDTDLYDKVQSNLEDLAFVSYDDNTTQYAHEIEDYLNAGGVVNASVWINITSVSGSTDTKVWCYYGNAGCVDQQYLHGVFDSNYVMVQHLNESAGSYYDTTINNNDGTLTDIDTDSVRADTGKIAGCINLHGDADYITVSDDNSLYLDSEFTIEVWCFQDDTAESTLLDKRGGGGNDEFTIEVKPSDDKGYLSITDSNAGSSWSNINYRTEPDETWSYLAWTYDGTALATHIDHYVDGWEVPLDYDAINSFSAIQDDNNDLLIGAKYTISGFFDGKIDEIRISKGVERSANYVNTTWYNLNNPLLFWSSGSEENSPGSASLAPTTYTFQGERTNTTYCNSSGSVYETGNFTLTHAGTDFDYLRINVTDIHANITSNNVAIQLSSDNVSWGANWKSGVTGGWSYIYNTTTWLEANGCYGVDPFPVVATDYIYMRIRVVIPAGIGIETYTSGSSCTWDVGDYT